jgi:aminoglycoside phosphotransferase (APT) family kinase protein
MASIEAKELAARATRAAQAWAPGCEVTDVETLEGGTVSLVFTARVIGGPAGLETLVLKVATPGLMPTRNRDVLRQARCMEAASRIAGVNVPSVLFRDAGDPPEVPPFFATSFSPGENSEPLLEAARNPQPEERVRGRAFAAARMLAALQKASPFDIGLADEPVVSLQGEIDRWTAALETVPDDFRVGYQECAAALAASAPKPLPPVLLHGDYRLGNMLCVEQEIRGIIDWEIWSVSDPRIDLTWFFFFTEEAKHPVVKHDVPSGMPTQAELLEVYEGALGTRTPDIEWFHALTRYKEAAAMALIAKHMRKRAAAEGGTPLMDGAVVNELIADAYQRVASL